MINNSDNPVEWALLVHQLEDAQEHLQNLIQKMCADKSIDEIDFKVSIGHVYSHLNRATNSRNHLGEIDEGRFNDYSQFPQDIEPN